MATKSSTMIPLRFSRPAELAENGSATLSAYSQLGGTAVTMRLRPPIELDAKKRWQLVVHSASIPYTIPNIGPASAEIPGAESGNNRFTVTWNAGVPTDYYVPVGLYGFESLALGMNIALHNAGLIPSIETEFITLVGIEATQRVILSLDPSVLSGGALPVGGVVISFVNPGASAVSDSMGTVLGFGTSGSAATLTAAGGETTLVSFAAPAVADFATLTEMIVQSDIVTGSYVDGRSAAAVLSVPLGDKDQNSVMSIEPYFPRPVPVSNTALEQMTFWVTSQDGRRLPAFAGPWSLVFCIQEA